MEKAGLGTLLNVEDIPGGSWTKGFGATANNCLERLLCIQKLKKLYQGISPGNDSFEFAVKALEALEVKPVLAEKDLKKIPSSGPAVVIANHPFGAIDGLILASVLSSVRKDVRILANYVLGAVPDLEEILFLVDPFGRKGSSARNLASMRKAVQWVQRGGMLVIFPAGEVSHLSWKSWKIEDPPWSDTAVRLIQLTRAPVVPVFFESRNSSLFQASGLLHPRLRTLLLPREILKRRSSSVRLRVGSPIPYHSLQDLETTSELKEYLRFRTYLLRYSLQDGKRIIRVPFKLIRNSQRAEAVVSEQNPFLLREEVESLPRAQMLMESNEFQVYFARSRQAPRLLSEIGRLREETFRLVGEGTGKSVDLDRFDNLYLHLFVWNRIKNEVVGAYRIGATDEVLSRHGRKGLYTHTLFRYEASFLNQISPALELGRSFVRKQYQRSYSPLLLLWKGIGRYVAAHPRYRVLFGPVSISNDYHSYSRQLMVAFLSMSCSLPDYQEMVRPRKPFRRKTSKRLPCVNMDPEGSIDELSEWISGIEPDGKGVPILLKQYLKLGGRLVSFNVDRNFKKALDGLVVVDLTRTEGKTLRRYMGDQGYDEFMEHHAAAASLHVPSAGA